MTRRSVPIPVSDRFAVTPYLPFPILGPFARSAKSNSVTDHCAINTPLIGSPSYSPPSTTLVVPRFHGTCRHQDVGLGRDGRVASLNSPSTSSVATAPVSRAEHALYSRHPIFRVNSDAFRHAHEPR